jgi:hypothetical protein
VATTREVKAADVDERMLELEDDIRSRMYFVPEGKRERVPMRVTLLKTKVKGTGR